MAATRKKDFKRPRINRGMPEGLRNFLDEQKTSFMPDIHLEVLDDGQAVLEGCRGILAYSGEFIRLGCGHKIVTFIGTNLELRCLSSSTAVVTGSILEIRYEG
ncbi:MAG: YabP/YqfC family sporulation protein [Oscillospiraceae bacterium]|nr:YabP/YqfC family sporulation protein [Oscillospiraceae bacterium]